MSKLTLNIFEIDSFAKEFYYYRDPFRLTFLDVNSRKFLYDILTDKQVVRYFKSSISDFELLLSYKWIRELQNSLDSDLTFISNVVLKDRLIFLLASTSALASDFSHLSSYLPLYLKQSYYVYYDSVSNYSVFNYAYLSNFIQVPAYFKGHLNRYVLFYFDSESRNRAFNTTFANFKDFNLPRLQSYSSSYARYFIYFRPFFKSIFFNETRTGNSTIPIFAYINWAVLLILSFIFLSFSCYYLFELWPWTKPLSIIKSFILADLQHKLYYLKLGFIDVEFIQNYFNDLDFNKFIRSIRTLFWSVWWSFKGALMMRYNLFIHNYARDPSRYWFIRRSIAWETPDGIIYVPNPKTIDLLDRWWF